MDSSINAFSIVLVYFASRKIGTKVMLCGIWYHLYNLKNVTSTHGGVLLLVKLKASVWNFTILKVTLRGCFLHFLNCANGSKSRKASQILSWPKVIQRSLANIQHRFTSDITLSNNRCDILLKHILSSGFQLIWWLKLSSCTSLLDPIWWLQEIDLSNCLSFAFWNHLSDCTKNEVSIEHFFSKCDQIRSFLRIWSHLPKKFLMENFMFCAMSQRRIQSPVKHLKAYLFGHLDQWSEWFNWNEICFLPFDYFDHDFLVDLLDQLDRKFLFVWRID